MNLRFATILMVVLAWCSVAPGSDIFDAAKDGDLEQVKALLKDNPDLVSKYDTGRMTPLLYAARYGHKDMVELLLNSGAEVNGTNLAGWTPLFCAARYGHQDVVETLLASNADVNATSGSSDVPLHVAAAFGYREITEMLLERNALVDAKNRFGYTPLRSTVESGHIDMVELLLAYKADVNTRDHFGETPLEVVKQVDMAKLLLANKADINAKDDVNGWTPLHSAAYRGSREVAELLLASNAVINAKDNRGGTPLHMAVQRESKAIVELLLTNNADVNARDNDGNTPLQYGFDEKEVAALLRHHGGHGKENTIKPLAGWYFDGDANSEHDKAILDDYQAYAHTVWPKDRDFFFSEVDFYEDGKGRHAIRVELEPGLREYKEYYLLYGTNNVRTKVIKGKTWHQFHI